MFCLGGQSARIETAKGQQASERQAGCCGTTVLLAFAGGRGTNLAMRSFLAVILTLVVTAAAQTLPPIAVYADPPRNFSAVWVLQPDNTLARHPAGAPDKVTLSLPHMELIGWLDGQRLLVFRNGELLEVDVSSGKTTTTGIKADAAKFVFLR